MSKKTPAPAPAAAPQNEAKRYIPPMRCYCDNLEKFERITYVSIDSTNQDPFSDGCGGTPHIAFQIDRDHLRAYIEACLDAELNPADELRRAFALTLRRCHNFRKP